MCQTSKNKETTKSERTLTQLLAQAEGSLAHMSFFRLGKGSRRGEQWLACSLA